MSRAFQDNQNGVLERHIWSSYEEVASV